jgi:hypothetical protein
VTDWQILRRFYWLQIIILPQIMKYTFLLLFVLTSYISLSQSNLTGIIAGNILDEKKKALEGVSVQLISLEDTSNQKSTSTDNTGFFSINGISFGHYRLRLSFVGLQVKVIDSLYFRADRFDFNLNDITLLQKASNNLEEVVIYTEKPLVESKDGNITFNAAESALSAGSNANELLTNVPLITKDPNGKLLVRGKEPKILIDDKPVELNQQQLQDLLESMPGSSIEKIEVLTNPPPQYANEQGGVINITTRKGRVGKSARVTVSGGTRGEASVNGNYNYRKAGFAMNINAGYGYNVYQNNSYAFRQNLISLRDYRTESSADNNNNRPNFRANFDYDFNKFHSLNVVLGYNQNQFDNETGTDFLPSYQISHRVIGTTGNSYNPNVSLAYTMRTKTPGEVLKVIAGGSYSMNDNQRAFYQQFLYADGSFTGHDSLLNQGTGTSTKTFNYRVNYDLPMKNRKTFLSAGSFFNTNISKINTEAEYKQSSDNKMVPLSALTYAFNYRQKVMNLRASAKQIIKPSMSITAGFSAEYTKFDFDVTSSLLETGNTYWSYLPFGTFNKNWKDILNITASYRRSIRRPGYGELSPIIDSSDLFNLRSGNPTLLPTLTDNFDLVLGKTKKSFYANIGLGINLVNDVFNHVRTVINDTTTLLMWQNSSGKKEYEASTWSGYTLSKKTRVNASASYTYNVYSGFDKSKRNFKDGGSLTSNLNTNYAFSDIWNCTGSFTYNNFSTPQGSSKSSLSMNIGIQLKAFQKKLALTVNFIDPFAQQKYHTFTYGSNFILENYNSSKSKNIRFTASYNFSKMAGKKSAKAADKNKKQLQNIMAPK